MPPSAASEEFRGVLSRRKGFFGSWVKGTYVKKANYLFEYTLGANHVSAEPLETFELDGSLIEDGHPITGKAASFVVHTTIGKSFFFLAPSMSDKTKWMELLSKPKAPAVSPSSSSSALHAAPTAHHHAPAVIHSDSVPPYEDSKGFQISDDVKDDLETKIPILKFLESFTDPVIVGNINGSIVAVNTATERLFSYSKPELVGAPISMLMPEPYRSQHDGYLFRHEKFGTEKLIGKTRNLKGERKGEEVMDIQISLGKLPVRGYFIATIREVNIVENDADGEKRRLKVKN